MDEVVERILQKAKEKGLDQKSLAKKIEIRHQAITEWKNGTTASYTKYIQQLAEVLDTTADYLLFGKTKGAPPTAEQQLDSALAAELATLTPDEVPLVRVFVQGLKAGRKAPTSPDK